MRTKDFASLAFLLLTQAAMPAASATLYSVFYDNRLGTVDDTTGAFTEIGTLPIAQAGGIAYDNGVLYAQDLQSNLITIDPASGLAAISGNAGVPLSSVGFAGGNNGLYEIDRMSNLYTIDPATGIATLAGITGLPPNYGYWDTSLADDGTSLYFTAGGAGAMDELYRINTLTGAATDLGSTGVSGVAGSAIVNGMLELFQYHWDGSPDYIYSAALGSTDFSLGPQLSAQVIDGAVSLDAPALSSFSAQGTSSAPEPLPLFTLGSALVMMLSIRWNASRRPAAVLKK